MVFDEELRAALDQIRTAPQLGSAYQIMPGREHRRVLMPETRYHVYYRMTDPGRVRVLAIWSAVRGRGPRL
jgi:plasmid stabilization system protein ParE